MKKIFTILMTLTLFITAFAGCAKQDSVVIDNKKEEMKKALSDNDIAFLV